VKTSSPVAFVYVSNFPGGTANVINAYTAAADGRLTPVPGSPFHDNVTSMAVNGKYLFGSNRLGVYVAAFLIQSNGALKWTTSTDVARHNPSGCVVPGDLIFDHTGADLYFAGTAGGECDSTLYQSFKVQRPDGFLQFLGNTPVSFLFNTPLSFSGTISTPTAATASTSRGITSIHSPPISGKATAC
jgi:6-phosphogluconolactonase (cycloisomerase 2 family)